VRRHAETAIIEAPALTAEALAENRFLAARDGSDARLIDPELETRVPVPDLLADLLAVCRPHAQDLGCEAELDSVAELAEDPPARRQIETGRNLPSLGRLVEHLADDYVE
jgi:carboxylate-amine ligase